MNQTHLIGAILIAALVVIGSMMGMASSGLKDVALKITRALANGAAAVTSSAIFTGKTTTLGEHPRDVEYLLSCPAMNATEMPDAKTMKYDILWGDSSDLTSSPTTHITAAVTQTGAGGVGCAAATFRFRLPSTAGPYVGFKATGSAAGNATTATATLEALV